MDNVLKNKDKCTGCTACYATCYKKAIKMQKDALGFYYPIIDEDLCSNCGVCVKVCPITDEKPYVDTRIKSYYGYVLDDKIVKESSSGGAFTYLADCVLKENGLVIGAVFDYQSNEVVYLGTDSVSLDEIRKSKYVASFPNKIFVRVKEELNNNRKVLFCGLPCHVDGLKSFLAKDYPNLITCDFICGGVSSPQFFKEYLAFLEKKYKSKTSLVNFRAKLYGWKEHSIKIGFENGKEYKSIAREDNFFQGYFEKFYQRKSCYDCKYRLRHFSDLIIADYWGGLSKGRGNDKGVSMIITNTKKGDEFFSNLIKVSPQGFKEMPIEDSNYVFKNETERYSKAIKNRAPFIEKVNRYGFIKATKKTYLKGVWKIKLKRKIKKLVKRV
jgi:coenzyme F420-reducing hydrogenase beta subunit